MKLSSEEVMNVLSCVDRQTTQKSIAEEVGYSVGKVNFILKALVDKGLIKVSNFVNSTSKKNYVYLLTEEGIKEKITLTERFIERKKREYDTLVAQLEEDKKKWGGLLSE